eukprot:c24153_g1_i2 orf=1086-2402(+)
MPSLYYNVKIVCCWNGNAKSVQCFHQFSYKNTTGEDARWRWQWIPLSFLMGIKLNCLPWKNSVDTSHHRPDSRHESTWPSPFVRLKFLTPILGTLVLHPVLELFPVPALTMKREFMMRSTKLTVQTNVEVSRCSKGLMWPQWTFQVGWQSAGLANLQVHSSHKTIAIRYSHGFNMFPDCKTVASAVAEVPYTLFSDCLSRFQERLPVRLKNGTFKFSKVFGTRATSDPPLSTFAYLNASKNIGKDDIITVVPGHWIDPGSEIGATGERDFNVEVANVVEKQLRGNGWEVLRPDRDAPYLSWEEYLNWVSKQTLKGIPVLEIHGQGSNADRRGIVIGVIGDIEAPLNKELARDFGYYKMNWRELGVPRRGGVIVESFNADEVLQMAPWHHTWAVRSLANRIVHCIECASFENRSARGMIVDLELDNDVVRLDKVFNHSC